MKHRIGIHGFYGMQNLGDEAILQALLQEGRSILKEFTPTVYSYRPDRIRECYGIESQPIIAQKRQLILQQWSLWRNQLFILGGGGLLHDYGPDSSGIRTWLSLLRNTIRLHRKTALFFIGVDRIRHKDSHRLIADTIPKVDFISVRDQRSADYLYNIGVEKKIYVAGDPAIMLVKPKVRKLSSKRRLRIGVCLRHWYLSKMQTEDDLLFEQILDELAKSLDKISQQYDAKIIFYPMRDILYDDDRKINKRVLMRMMYQNRAECIEECPSITEFLTALEKIDIVVAMRLHAGILPSAMGIPVIVLEYMPKISEYMKAIDQSEFVIPMQVPIMYNLHNCFDFIINNYDSVNNHLIDKISNEQKSVKNIIKAMLSSAFH